MEGSNSACQERWPVTELRPRLDGGACLSANWCPLNDAPLAKLDQRLGDCLCTTR